MLASPRCKCGSGPDRAGRQSSKPAAAATQRSAAPTVTPVEDRLPAAARVRRRLPVLADIAIRQRCPRDSLSDRLAARSVHPLAFQHHRAVTPAAFEHQQRTFVVHPRLVPEAARRVVGIDAATARATRAAPALLERAAAEDPRDVVVACVPLTLRDTPVTDPEVELAEFRHCAVRGRHRPERGCRSRQPEHGEQAGTEPCRRRAMTLNHPEYLQPRASRARQAFDPPRGAAIRTRVPLSPAACPHRRRARHPWIILQRQPGRCARRSEPLAARRVSWRPSVPIEAAPWNAGCAGSAAGCKASTTAALPRRAPGRWASPAMPGTSRTAASRCWRAA